MITYSVRTNLNETDLNTLGLEIFRMWVDFALGDLALGGRKLGFPSGKYASAIRYERRNAKNVIVYVGDTDPPEAGILETGHKPVDLKTKLKWNKLYPMHRTQSRAPNGRLIPVVIAGSKTKLRRRGSSIQGMRPEIWAEARSDSFSGFAQISSKSPPGSWVIPAMPAYAPARNLAMMARKMAQAGVNVAFA